MRSLSLSALFLMIVIVLVACGTTSQGGNSQQNPAQQFVQVVTDSPDKAAKEYLQGLADLDGLKVDDLTCSSQKEALKQTGLAATALIMLGQNYTGQQVKVDISGLQITTVQSSGDSASVQVAGKIRTAIGLEVQSQQINDKWRMVKEEGKWKYCGKVEPAAMDPVPFARCGDVETLPDEGRGHIQPGETPVYQQVPPTSGNHNPDPMPPSIYDTPIDVTREVHSLEHGYVIIHYNGIPAEQIGRLRAIVRADSRKLILSPYPNMPYKVSLTAWDHRQTCDGVNTDAIRAFINTFRDQGPEQTPF